MIKSKKNYLSIFKKLTISLISLILFFLVVEVTLRLIGFKYDLCEDLPTAALSRDITKKVFGIGCIPSTVLGYELEPDFKGEMWNTWITVNSKGFRDNDVAARKPGNTFRIICLGDSSTFGVKVKLEDTYAKRLESILNENKELKQYEVINAGCAGYTSFSGLKLLQENGLLAYNPDIVTIYFGLNDEFMWHALSDRNSYQIRMLNKVFNRSKLYSFLWKIVSKIVPKYNLRLIERVGKLTIRVSLAEFEENLKEINKLLKNHKIKVLFMTYPFKPELFPRDEFQSLERLKKYNDIIRKLSKNYGITLLDLEEIFTVRHNNSAKLFADYCHPSYYGHKIIAEEIYRKLAKDNFITENSINFSKNNTDLGGYDFQNNLDKAIVNATKELTPTLGGCVINNEFRYCISQHPPSELIYRIRFSKDWSKLNFGIGLFPNVWSFEKGDGVLFEIDVDDGNGFQHIFSKHIDPKGNPQDRKWHDYEIDFKKFRGKELRVSLRTSPGPLNDNYGDWAVWSDPKIE